MKYLVLSCSLRPASLSRVLAQAAHDRLADHHKVDVALLDLQELHLPMCDGHNAYDHPNAVKLSEQVEAADGLLMAMPVYNYYGSAAAKNVIELTGREGWGGKIAGFLCAAGGRGSYMSVMQIADSMMLDFRTVIIPRFVYATGNDFEDRKITSELIQSRIEELAAELVRFTEALRGNRRNNGAI